MRKYSFSTSPEHKGLIAQPLVTGRTVASICAIFGIADGSADLLVPDAFIKTLREDRRRIRFLWCNDFNLPPTARIDDIRTVTRADLPDAIKAAFPAATGGLQVKRTYLETERGSEILEAVRAGALNETAIGYIPVLADTVRVSGKSIRRLLEVRLLDVSDVPWGTGLASAGGKRAGLPLDHLALLQRLDLAKVRARYL